MPVWARGNQCFTVTTNKYDFIGGTTLKMPIAFVNEPSSLGDWMVWQPGVIRGFNMYVGTNTASQDIDVQFRKLAWDGDTGYTTTHFTLFTILAGETGYFCASPVGDAADLASRSWASRDQISIRLRRDFGGGAMEKITWGCCLEITEEALVDNDGPPNL